MNLDAPGRIECLIFDLFGVVVAFDDTLVYDRIARRCSDPDFAYERLANVVSDPRLICGDLSIEDLHTRLVADIGLQSSFEEFAHTWRRSYSEPMPGMRDLLYRLHGQCRLVLLSNVDRYYWPTVAATVPELGRFHACLTSFAQGVAKPHPEAFAGAVNAAGTNIAHCYLVDDKQENIESAASIGLRGHAFRDARRLKVALRNAGLKV